MPINWKRETQTTGGWLTVLQWTLVEVATFCCGLESCSSMIRSWLYINFALLLKEPLNYSQVATSY